MNPYSELRYAIPLMKAGFSPLWNPALSCGSPLFAQPGLALGYPGSLINLLFPASWAWLLFLVLHGALAFAGARRVAGDFGLRMPALLFAAAYAGLGLALGWKVQPSMAAGLAWLPWALLCRGGSTVASWALLCSTADPVSITAACLATLIFKARRSFWRPAAWGVAMAAAALLPTVQGMALLAPSGSGIGEWSPEESGRIGLQLHGTRAAVQGIQREAGLPQEPVAGLSWAGGSRRPTRAYAGLARLMEISEETKDRLLSLCGVSLLLKPGTAEGQQRLNSPLRAAWVSAARLRKNDADSLALDAKPFYSRPLMLEEPGLAQVDDAVSANWTLLQADFDAQGEASVELPAGHDRGWLFLSDSRYPGWEARVDGEARPQVLAEKAFRAVSVDALAKSLRFVYRPWLFYAGFGISVFMALLALFRPPKWETLR